MSEAPKLSKTTQDLPSSSANSNSSMIFPHLGGSPQRKRRRTSLDESTVQEETAAIKTVATAMSEIQTLPSRSIKSAIFSGVDTSSVTSTQKQAKSNKSKSPVKIMGDLKFTSKPPMIQPVDGMPQDVKTLYQTLNRINRGSSLIPAIAVSLLQNPIIPLEGWEIDHSIVAYTKELSYEIDQAIRITDRASIYFREHQSEASWNCGVHFPALNVALTGVPNVREFNISSATICPKFLPKLEVSGETIQSKLVDFSVNLAPEPKSPLARAIRAILSSQPYNVSTITPTMYEPVRWCPQAVAIETKVADAGSNPLLQLSIWGAASIERVRQLMIMAPARVRKENEVTEVITLPLVQVRGHYWEVWFARETSDAIDLYGPVELGTTQTLISTFKLIRSLRALGSKSSVKELVDAKPNKRDLELYENSTVEDPVTDSVLRLSEISKARQLFGLPDEMRFASHANELSDIAEEVQERLYFEHSHSPTRNPSTLPIKKSSAADRICLCQNTDGTPRLLVEYKAPHKLSVEDLGGGLRDTNTPAEFVNRTMIPTDRDKKLNYTADRLVVAQTFAYMIENSLEYSHVTTSEAYVFLQVRLDDPTTVYYHLTDPNVEAEA